MTELAPRIAEPSVSGLEPLEARAPKPITYWAWLGAAFAALNVWIYVRWLMAGDLWSTPTGIDDVPLKSIIAARTTEVLSVTLAIAAVIVVVRQCRRERRLTFDAIFLIAWMLASWQDPLVNYLRPQFFYNAEFVNVGSWAPYIPGWASPLAGNFAHDILFTAPTGYAWFVLVVMLGCKGMRAVKKRWPGTNQVGLFLTAFVVAAGIDFIVEYIAVRFLELWAYPGAVHALSFGGGGTGQFPIYSMVIWGLLWATQMMLRYNLDDHGLSSVERGAGELRMRKGRVNAMRILAVTGIVNLGFLVYCISMIFFNLLPGTDTPEGYPSYLRDSLCGDGTQYACPARDVPIHLDGPAR